MPAKGQKARTATASDAHISSPTACVGALKSWDGWGWGWVIYWALIDEDLGARRGWLRATAGDGGLDWVACFSWMSLILHIRSFLM